MSQADLQRDCMMPHPGPDSVTFLSLLSLAYGTFIDVLYKCMRPIGNQISLNPQVTLPKTYRAPH